MPNGDEAERVASGTSEHERSVDPRGVNLDPYNPRLTEEQQGSSQEELLAIMIQRFNIEELAEAIVAAGFLDFDPIIGWEEDDEIFVREGNRRIATLQLLLEPDRAAERYRDKWREHAERLRAETREDIQNIRMAVFSERDDVNVTSYVGFRHVAGVKQWPSHEKAAFIAKLIEDHGWNYDSIADRLGSYPKHVERHYIAHRIVQQARNDGINGADQMSKAFGVLLRGLQASGVKEFLGFDYPGDPEESERPIPEDHEDNLNDFVVWTFGTEDRKPVLKDSRQLTRWGRILQSDEAVAWMRRSELPEFDRAWMKSGGQVESLADSLNTAADRLQESVPLVRRFQEDASVRSAVDLCTDFLSQILRYFPDVADAHGLHIEDDDV